MSPFEFKSGLGLGLGFDRACGRKGLLGRSAAGSATVWERAAVGGDRHAESTSEAARSWRRCAAAMAGIASLALLFGCGSTDAGRTGGRSGDQPPAQRTPGSSEEIPARGSGGASRARYAPAGEQGVARGVFWFPARAGSGAVSPDVRLDGSSGPAAAAPQRARFDRWILLLPDGSGSEVLGDAGRAADVAESFASAGWQAMIVDARAAYRSVRGRPQAPPGGRTAWAIEQVIDWTRRSSRLSYGDPGAIMTWSFGAAEVLPLLADRRRCDELGLRAAVLWYPAVDPSLLANLAIPTLIVLGDRDDFVSAAALTAAIRSPPSAARRSASGSAPHPQATLLVLPGARHGFDVSAHAQPSTITLGSFPGRSGLVAFDEGASAQATAAIEAFLAERVREPAPTK
ncbi:MAG TPA: hypothetical protein PKC43_04020 [Phycisphaerales bacterium]|nr:hypothetical protein [Phycisphaerales bacterium]HMP36593.1 hypothetical protein [Phycisphaerales bacterium]